MLPSLPPTVLGPVLAAAIAAAVAYLAAVLSKELKTSEFRQAWIDALRNDLADLASLALMTDDIIAHKTKHGSATDVHTYIIEHQDDFAKLIACAIRVELRLNPVEHSRLLSIVRKVGTSTKTFQGNTDDTAKAASELIEESQRVLKAEWSRVKKGELVFRVAKWSALSLLLLAALALLRHAVP